MVLTEKELSSELFSDDDRAELQKLLEKTAGAKLHPAISDFFRKVEDALQTRETPGKIETQTEAEKPDPAAQAPPAPTVKAVTTSVSGKPVLEHITTRLKPTGPAVAAKPARDPEAPPKPAQTKRRIFSGYRREVRTKQQMVFEHPGLAAVLQAGPKYSGSILRARNAMARTGTAPGTMERFYRALEVMGYSGLVGSSAYSRYLKYVEFAPSRATRLVWWVSEQKNLTRERLRAEVDRSLTEGNRYMGQEKPTAGKKPPAEMRGVYKLETDLRSRIGDDLVADQIESEIKTMRPDRARTYHEALRRVPADGGLARQRYAALAKLIEVGSYGASLIVDELSGKRGGMTGSEYDSIANGYLKLADQG